MNTDKTDTKTVTRIYRVVPPSWWSLMFAAMSLFLIDCHAVDRQDWVEVCSLSVIVLALSVQARRVYRMRY